MAGRAGNDGGDGAKTATRAARQARALRANLARRKAQAKARGAAAMAPIKNPERTAKPAPD